VPVLRVEVVAVEVTVEVGAAEELVEDEAVVEVKPPIWESLVSLQLEIEI